MHAVPNLLWEILHPLAVSLPLARPNFPYESVFACFSLFFSGNFARNVGFSLNAIFAFLLSGGLLLIANELKNKVLTDGQFRPAHLPIHISCNCLSNTILKKPLAADRPPNQPMLFSYVEPDAFNGVLQQWLSSAKPLQKYSPGAHLFWAWASKIEAWRRENCTVYAGNGQLCNKRMNQWREASYPWNSTVPRLQMLGAW